MPASSYPQGPPPEDLKETIAAILREDGFHNVTLRSLRGRLEGKYNLDFTSHNEKMQECIDELMETKEFQREMARVHETTEQATTGKKQAHRANARRTSPEPGQLHRVLVEDIPLHVSHSEFYTTMCSHFGGADISNALLIPAMQTIASAADVPASQVTGGDGAAMLDDRRTKSNEGFAFVDYRTRSAVAACVRHNLRLGGVQVKQRIVGVTRKRPREERSDIKSSQPQPTTVCTDGWTRASASDLMLAIGGILAACEKTHVAGRNDDGDGVMLDAVCGVSDAYGNILIR